MVRTRRKKTPGHPCDVWATRRVHPSCIQGDPDSFSRSMKRTIVMGQWFALLPVQGVTTHDVTHIRFRWRSFRVFYTILALFAISLSAALCIIRLNSTGITFSGSAALVFYVNTFTSLFLFLLLARDWPVLSRHWHSVETSLSRYRYPGGLTRKTNCITFIILCLFLLEYTLSNVKTGLIAARCSKGGLNVLRFFFVNRSPHVFDHVSYSLPVGLCTLYVNLTCSFTWNYTDLFIILVSVHLADKFRRINRRLATVEGKDLPEMFWFEAREEYNQLSYLTKTVDDKLSKIVLLSFGNNLYFICLQTLHSFEPLGSVYETVYFSFSFGYLLVRTVAVSMFAGGIHDQSKRPRHILYSVPENSCCEEVQRFLTQVTSDEVAITGHSFFSVTRSLLLKIAGTIMTYAIVLVQLSESEETDNLGHNSTTICDGTR